MKITYIRYNRQNRYDITKGFDKAKNEFKKGCDKEIMSKKFFETAETAGELFDEIEKHFMSTKPQRQVLKLNEISRMVLKPKQRITNFVDEVYIYISKQKNNNN